MPERALRGPRTPPGTIEPEKHLTSHEVAKMLQVNPSSVNKWVKENRIQAHRTPGGHRRIKATDLVAFLTTYEIPVPNELAHVIPTPVSKRKKR